MADEAKMESGEEEYVFSEQETPSSFTTAAQPTAGTDKPKTNKNRPIMIVLGIIIAVFILYKLLDILFASRIKETMIQNPAGFSSNLSSAPIQQAEQSHIQQQPMPPNNQLAQSNQNQVMGAAINDRVGALEQQSSATQSSVSSLGNQVSQMQNSMSDLNTRVSNLTNAVQELTSKFAEEEAQKAAIAEEKAAKHKARKIVARPQPIFFVRAMVQGRAWLSTGSGGTVTVSVGDNLPGYGIVETIDPTQGILVTSSGAIIGYSPTDS